MKAKTLSIIVSVSAVMIVIAYFIYFVSGVSATYPSIREYSYEGSPDKLIKNIKSYAMTDTNIIFTVEDTTGDLNSDYAIYISIKRQNTNYNLKLEEKIFDKKKETSIELVGVYDRANNIGGYSKNAKGIDRLVDRFNVDVLVPLQDKQGIKIIPAPDSK